MTCADAQRCAGGSAAEGTGCESRTIPVTVKPTNGRGATASGREGVREDEAKPGDRFARNVPLASGVGTENASTALLCLFGLLPGPRGAAFLPFRTFSIEKGLFL